MATQPEETIMIAHESVLHIRVLLKIIFTLGIYLFWWRAKYVMVTTKRIVMASGLISKEENSVPLAKVQDIKVDYGFLGRLLGYGDLLVEASSEPGPELEARGINNPEAIKQAIIKQLR
jgi:uncharacterized membrane protein YdbT with pleckstrin-like domain